MVTDQRLERWMALGTGMGIRMEMEMEMGMGIRDLDS